MTTSAEHRLACPDPVRRMRRWQLAEIRLAPARSRWLFHFTWLNIKSRKHFSFVWTILSVKLPFHNSIQLYWYHGLPWAIPKSHLRVQQWCYLNCRVWGRVPTFLFSAKHVHLFQPHVPSPGDWNGQARKGPPLPSNRWEVDWFWTFKILKVEPRQLKSQAVGYFTVLRPRTCHLLSLLWLSLAGALELLIISQC